MRVNRAALLLLSFALIAACKKAEPKNGSSPKEPARDAVVRPLSPSVGSRVAIAEVAGRRSAIVSDEEDQAVLVVDLETHAVSARSGVGGAVGQILVAPNGTIYAAVRGAAKVVALRVRQDGALVDVRSAETGHEPWGLALSPDGADLWVTSIGDARLESFGAHDLAPKTKIDLPRDPRSVITSDGKRLFVSHAVGSVMSIVDVSPAAMMGSARSVQLDAVERRRDFGMKVISKPQAPMFPGEKTPPPPEVRMSMKRAATQGFALAAIGDKVFVPETLVLTDDTKGIPTGYGNLEQSTLSTHVPFVARVDRAKGDLENRDFSGPEDRKCFERKASCLLPRAVAEADTTLLVACLDGGVIAIDTTADYEHGSSCEKAFKTRKRIDVEAPSAVAFERAQNTIVIFSDATRRLSIAPLEGWSETTFVELPRHEAAPSELASTGRRLFHTSGADRISKNGRACASCHPDGRDDALVWPTPKGKRQTPMLAGRIVGTAPYDWNGAHESLEIHITSTLKNLEGKGLPNEDLLALAAYVTSLAPPPRRAKSTDALAHGAALFRSNETGCGSCHVEAMRLSDGATHALGKGKEQFDTPSLAFVGMTPPYFHDGRFASLEELVTKCDGEMGHTGHLSDADKKDLVAYLRSL